jgi:hypothetical protein
MSNDIPRLVAAGVDSRPVISYVKPVIHTVRPGCPYRHRPTAAPMAARLIIPSQRVLFIPVIVEYISGLFIFTPCS